MDGQMEFGGTAPPVRRDMMVALAALPPNEDLTPLEASADLVESMKRFGQLEPIILRQLNGHLEPIAGGRRIKAARKLGWAEIRALVGEATPDDALAGLHENLAREDNQIQTLMAVWELARENKSAKEIAHLLPGLTASQVRVRLELLRLPHEAQRALLEGRLMLSAAQLAAKEGAAIHAGLLALLADPAKKRIGPADIAALKAALPRPQATFEEVFGFSVPSAAEVEAAAPDPVLAWSRRAAGTLRDLLIGAPETHPAHAHLVAALRLVAQEG